MPHLLGYARVCTADRNPDLQQDALKAVGCYRIFVDTASGALDDLTGKLLAVQLFHLGGQLIDDADVYSMARTRYHTR